MNGEAIAVTLVGWARAATVLETTYGVRAAVAHVRRIEVRTWKSAWAKAERTFRHIADLWAAFAHPTSAVVR